ncbi:hypothetical protein [Sphingobium fluviale]|uniref:Uncharacterized protein n=1 Tax=Sphingobium fluviale TaxID=2506423 RepID=A0A4Q1KIL3_9SPHN|nr:hypothetical protein [Sphingobium fluviale]RXR29155.1 hypothetical protein EQG66_06570 [Sphingobium fluviale]
MSCRRNRVTPDGDIIAIPARGRLMGNRGRLVDQCGEIVRHFERERWISCVLDEVHGGPVAMDNPNSYTPLFFTDDAVALAAGHRPCGQCRQDDYGRFLAAWKRMQGISGHIRVYSEEMDANLHARRMRWRSGRDQRAIPFDQIPSGAFFRSDRISPHPLLYWAGRLWPWAEGAYLAPLDVADSYGHVGGPWHFSWKIIAHGGMDWRAFGPQL